MSLYEVLGVARGCTREEVRRAFRRVAAQTHPDKTDNDPAKAELFRRASEAAAVLGDDERRAAYDADADMPPAGEVELDVTLEEALAGAEKTVDVPRACAACAGQGVRLGRPAMAGIFWQAVTLEPCDACGGLGVSAVSARTRVRVPPGCADGELLAGGCVRARHAFPPGVRAGEGGSLVLRVPVELPELLAGFERSVEVAGERFDVRVAGYFDVRATRPVVPGKGLARPRGDLVLEFELRLGEQPALRRIAPAIKAALEADAAAPEAAPPGAAP